MNPYERRIKRLLVAAQNIKQKLAIIELNEEFKICVPKTADEMVDRIIEKMALVDALKLINRDLLEITKTCN